MAGNGGWGWGPRANHGRAQSTLALASELPPYPTGGGWNADAQSSGHSMQPSGGGAWIHSDGKPDGWGPGRPASGPDATLTPAMGVVRAAQPTDRGRAVNAASQSDPTQRAVRLDSSLPYPEAPVSTHKAVLLNNPEVLYGLRLQRTFPGPRGREAFVYVDSNTGEEYTMFGALERSAI
jgi:hypothetical protein